jgi:hypothetical protein
MGDSATLGCGCKYTVVTVLQWATQADNGNNRQGGSGNWEIMTGDRDDSAININMACGNWVAAETRPWARVGSSGVSAVGCVAGQCVGWMAFQQYGLSAVRQ